MTTIEIILTVAVAVIAIADLLTHQRADARLNDAERDISVLGVDQRLATVKLTVELDKLAARIPPVKPRKPRSESGPVKRADAPIPFVPVDAKQAPFVVDLTTPMADVVLGSDPDGPARAVAGGPKTAFRGTPKKPEGDDPAGAA